MGESVRFRSFEDDLLTDQQWQQKDQLLIDTDLPLLRQPIAEHLVALEQQLETRWAEVNQRIASGENTAVQFTSRNAQGRWTLQYPQSSEPVNHPFFDALQQVDISQVLAFTHRHCRFMEAFEHVLGRYVKQPADERALTACLIAWGTNMGLGKRETSLTSPITPWPRLQRQFLALGNVARGQRSHQQRHGAAAHLPSLRYWRTGPLQ